ncbi:hypothetical protein BpHYR1_048649 [Brachionus plicatilis]|uniref:Uncharacterized protein n=1 Tax=Brachionus plicatilis TaxID=10195 RepID=A0A3M7RLP2_BRAPC|nr:hypothetical protein BpHYR1_048649 [Brachionus plicatilis]
MSNVRFQASKISKILFQKYWSKIKDTFFSKKYIINYILRKLDKIEIIEETDLKTTCLEQADTFIKISGQKFSIQDQCQNGYLLLITDLNVSRCNRHQKLEENSLAHGLAT